MSRKIGVFCILLGICCLFSSVVFVGYNHWEESRAKNASKYLLQDVQDKIIYTTNIESDVEAVLGTETAVIEHEKITTMQVDGYDCIGVLSIPVLELELPVMTDWSYEKLKIAPCHYYGTYYETDFVIAAHNYQSHFGRISELQPKDLIMFTDISGTIHYYEVVLLETLPGNATKEMITSGFDLSLYTCTTGGSGRVTVRCKAVKK